MEKNTTSADQLRNKQFDNGANNNRNSNDSNHDMGSSLSTSSGSSTGSSAGLSAGHHTGSTSGSGSNLGSNSGSGLSSSLGHAENSMEYMKDSAMNTFNDAKKSWSNIEQALLAKGQEAGKASRIYIYQNPFRSVLVASAAGLIFGFLLSVLRK